MRCQCEQQCCGGIRHTLLTKVSSEACSAGNCSRRAVTPSMTICALIFFLLTWNLGNAGARRAPCASVKVRPGSSGVSMLEGLEQMAKVTRWRHRTEIIRDSAAPVGELSPKHETCGAMFVSPGNQFRLCSPIATNTVSAHRKAVLLSSTLHHCCCRKWC